MLRCRVGCKKKKKETEASVKQKGEQTPLLQRQNEISTF